MALPWIKTVSDEIAAVFPFLQRAVRENVGADTLYRFLHESGYEVVRSELRDAMSDLRSQFFAGEYIRNLPQDYIPDPSLIPTSVTAQLLPYRYVFTVRGTDRLSGESTEYTRSMLSSDLLSPADAVGSFEEYAERPCLSRSYEYEGASLTEITRRA